MPKDLHTGRYRIDPGPEVRLSDFDPNDTSGFEGKDEDEQKESKKLNEKLLQLQEMLYAEHEQKVLVVLQAMDTGGKDGVINRVFQGVNPQGVRVAHFKEPTPEELDHGFLWREHRQVPGNGELTIFNRRLLFEEETTILKFYLHIDKDEQKKRLQQRLDDPSKRWKFSGDDLPERKFWKEYLRAYEDALNKTSTEYAPWYLIPANHKWYRDLVVSRIIVKVMEKMNLHYPKTKLSLSSITIE